MDGDDGYYGGYDDDDDAEEKIDAIVWKMNIISRAMNEIADIIGINYTMPKKDPSEPMSHSYPRDDEDKLDKLMTLAEKSRAIYAECVRQIREEGAEPAIVDDALMPASERSGMPPTARLTLEDVQQHLFAMILDAEDTREIGDLVTSLTQIAGIALESMEASAVRWRVTDV